jgi:hypothetical protein
VLSAHDDHHPEIFGVAASCRRHSATSGPARFRPHSELGQNGEHALAFILVGLEFGLAYPRHRLLTAATAVVTIGTLEILATLDARTACPAGRLCRKRSGGLPGWQEPQRWIGQCSECGAPAATCPDLDLHSGARAKRANPESRVHTKMRAPE